MKEDNEQEVKLEGLFDSDLDMRDKTPYGYSLLSAALVGSAILYNVAGGSPVNSNKLAMTSDSIDEKVEEVIKKEPIKEDYLEVTFDPSIKDFSIKNVSADKTLKQDIESIKTSVSALYDPDEFRDLTCGRGTPYSQVLKNAVRFKDLINEHEIKYGMPRGLLAGLMIQESCGNPLQLNSSGDGGAGLFQFQPGTARERGLLVYGNSNATGRDPAHHRELERMLRAYNNDINELRVVDERFDPEKATKAAASYLNDLRKRHGTWERAVSAYNAGRPVRNYSSSPHVRGVKKFQNMFNNHLSSNYYSSSQLSRNTQSNSNKY